MSADPKPYGFTPLAVLLSAILMACAGGLGWYNLDRLRHDFNAVQGRTFHLAEHLEQRRLALNATLRSFGVRPDPAALTDFQTQAAAMKLWLQTNRLSVTRAPQRDLLDRVEAALDADLARTARIVDETTRAGAGAKPKSVSEQLAAQASPLPGLIRELASAEQLALDQLIKESRRSMSQLYLQAVLAVGIAFILGLAALRLIHVARIAPLQAQLDQSRSILEQQQRLAALGTLAAGVAHEVRNPLACIKIRLHGLRRVLPGNESALDDVNVIEHAVKRLERLVTDFLRFAQPSPPEVEVIPAAALFEQVKGLLTPQVEAAGLRCRIEAPPELCVRADPQQLEQVLINLIQNAAENTPRGGTITLRAATAPARRPAGSAAPTVLEVADTGNGIPPAVARRMFDPFFSTKEVGTGLGLSIATRIIENNGGEIGWQTKVGHGTTFTLTLPGAEKQPP